MIKQISKHLILGVLVASFVGLLLPLLSAGPSLLTHRSILSLFALGGAIGLLSMIFNVDRLAFLPALCLHFVGTAGLMWRFYQYNGWQKFLTIRSAGGFLLVYVVIWVAIHLWDLWLVRGINNELKARDRR